MRIVGGIYGGRVLAGFKGEEIRPTSDNAREALFNILRFPVVGARFLDLFCGTGAVGIEALSRGAESVTFNDSSRDSITLTKKNLSALKIEKGIKVFNFDAVRFLDGTTEVYDIVFIDAPYKDTVGITALNKVSPVLDKDGIVVYENEKPFTESVSGLIKYDERKYGRAYLTFFKKENE